MYSIRRTAIQKDLTENVGDDMIKIISKSMREVKKDGRYDISGIDERFS